MLYVPLAQGVLVAQCLHCVCIFGGLLAWLAGCATLGNNTCIAGWELASWCTAHGCLIYADDGVLGCMVENIAVGLNVWGW